MKLLTALAWVAAGFALIVVASIGAGKMGMGGPSFLLWATAWVGGIAFVDHGVRKW